MTDKIKEKKWFCRHCGHRRDGLILYCSECGSDDALISDKFSFDEGYRTGLKEIVKYALERKERGYAK